MAKSLDQRFGEALRKLREAAGKTQENFAGIGRTYLSELERGLKTPTLETIVRLAAELGVPPTRLVELATTTAPITEEPQSPLVDALKGGLVLAAERKGGPALPALDAPYSFSVVEGAATHAGIELPELLAEAALVAFRRARGRAPRERRRGLRFLMADKRPASMLEYAKDAGTAWTLSPEIAQRALEKANVTLELADDVLGMNGIPFYELLGTRNLGSFVGAVYGYSLRNEMADRLMVNGHQDGYPDLCALTTAGKAYLAKIRAEGMGDAKKSWASYPEGGIEIKTTCGAVPTPTKTRKKPGIGDQRSNKLTGADWKAHHRETNRLLGLFWDFIDRVPTVTALFYRNDLTEADWGEVIVPTTDDATVDVGHVEEGMDGEVVVDMAIGETAEEEGNGKKKGKKKKAGRTTSVSIMTSTAVKKMGKGWIVLPGDPELLEALARPRIFDLGLAEVEDLTSSVPATVRTVLEKFDNEKRAQQQVVVARVAVKPPKDR